MSDVFPQLTLVWRVFMVSLYSPWLLE